MPDGLSSSDYAPNQPTDESREQGSARQERDSHRNGPDASSESTLAETVRGVAQAIVEGRIETDIPGVEVQDNKVNIGDKRELPDEVKENMVDRSRVVEWMVPLEAVKRDGTFGNTHFLMREHIPTKAEENSEKPTIDAVMEQSGAEKHYPKGVAFLGGHGWVSADKYSAEVDEEELQRQKDEEGDVNLTTATKVNRETYFSKLMPHLPKGTRVFTLEPPGAHTIYDEAGNPFTSNEDMQYLDIDNYTLAMEEAVREYARQVGIDLDAPIPTEPQEPVAKMVVAGHSWGGRAAAQLDSHFIEEMHARGLDIATYLMEPAFRMQPYFKVAEVAVGGLKQLIESKNEPRNTSEFMYKRILEKVRDRATQAVIEQAGTLMNLEPTDSMMKRVRETSMPATLLPLADLSARPMTDEHIRQLIRRPWVGRVEMSSRDTLVQNSKAPSQFEKTYTITDRGHVAQRDDIVGWLEAQQVLGLLAVDQFREIDEEAKVIRIKQELLTHADQQIQTIDQAKAA